MEWYSILGLFVIMLGLVYVTNKYTKNNNGKMQ